MFWKLFFLFTIIPVGEIYLLVQVGERIGGLNTIAIVILTGIIGAAFARSQGALIIGKIKTDLDSGRMPGNEMVEGLLILAGGILLVTPGIVTDLFGFSLIFPLSRVFYRKVLIGYFKGKISVDGIAGGFGNPTGFDRDRHYDPDHGSQSDDDNIIDV